MDPLDWSNDYNLEDLDLSEPHSSDTPEASLPFTTLQMPDPSFTSFYPYDVPLMKQENYDFNSNSNWAKSGLSFSSWLPPVPQYPTEQPVIKMEPVQYEPQQPMSTFLQSPHNQQILNSKLQQVAQSSKKRAIDKTMETFSTSEIDIIIEGQPPPEVRTRTPSEVRTFSVSCQITGNFKAQGGTIMKIGLWYAPDDATVSEPVEKEILGGSKTLPVAPDGKVVFDNLTISESSTKHKEREFYLVATLLKNDGHELLHKATRSFYAYSHKKVLQRRGSVRLRTVSKTYGRMSGGESMHVIGLPFIQGPALGLIVRTPHGDVHAKPLEYFSESVLFFELPPYPVTSMLTQENEVKVQILVTNDGRTFSNPVDFTYIPDAKAIRARI